MKLTEENEIKIFLEKFGTFFEEFKDEGIKDWLFYYIYIFRRVAIQFSYLFISDGILQLSLSMMISFSVIFKQIPFYIAVVRGFNSRIYNAFHFINEILIGVYHVVIISSLFKNNSNKSEDFANACINIIITAWALNIMISITRTLKKIAEKIKEIIINRKKNKVEDNSQLKTGKDQEAKRDDLKVYDLD